MKKGRHRTNLDYESVSVNSRYATRHKHDRGASRNTSLNGSVADLSINDETDYQSREYSGVKKAGT